MLTSSWYKRRLPLITQVPRAATAPVSRPIVPGILVAGANRNARTARPIWVRATGIASTAATSSVPTSSIRLGATARGTILLTGGPAMSVTSSMSLFRGEDKNLDFQMIPAVDVTGWSLTFTLKDTLGGVTQFTRAATILDGPRGRFRVTIASADTASLAVGRYVWDCRRTDSGNKTTVADGTLDLRQEITA